MQSLDFLNFRFRIFDFFVGFLASTSGAGALQGLDLVWFRARRRVARRGLSPLSESARRKCTQKYCAKQLDPSRKVDEPDQKCAKARQI